MDIFPATRSDLDALNNADRNTAMDLLAATIYRFERDDAQKTIVVVEDLSTITRYGFTRDDFPDVVTPAPPEWWPAQSIEQYHAGLSCSPAQGRLLLYQQDVLDDIEVWIASQPRPIQIEYESRTEWRRTWTTIITAIEYLGWTDEQADQFFETARTL